MYQENKIIKQVILNLFSMKQEPTSLIKNNNSVELKIIKCLILLSTMEKPAINNAKEILSNIDISILKKHKYQLYFNICKYWQNGQYKRVHTLLEQVLDLYKQDLLSIYLIHMLEFYMGWTKQLLISISKSINNFSNKASKIYGYLKGIESFALEENGLYEQAFASAKIALSYNYDDIYAIHSICHIFLEQGKYKEGIEYLENNIDKWSTNYGMRIHVWWHKAIFHFYLMDIKEVMDIYNNKLKNKNIQNGLEDIDTTSLLWRLHLVDINVDKEYEEISKNWESNISSNDYWFNSLHSFALSIVSLTPFFASLIGYGRC